MQAQSLLLILLLFVLPFPLPLAHGLGAVSLRRPSWVVGTVQRDELRQVKIVCFGRLLGSLACFKTT